jgi:hypothetical protein
MLITGLQVARPNANLDDLLIFEVVDGLYDSASVDWYSLQTASLFVLVLVCPWPTGGGNVGSEQN